MRFASQALRLVAGSWVLSGELTIREVTRPVDLEVEFLGSAGISVLMKTRDNLGDSVPFCVVADGPATHRPLTLLGINELMSVCRRLDDAVGKLTDG